MDKKNAVSEMDALHLKLIRQNVQDLLEDSANRFDKEGNLLLDIAPQIYAGAKAHFKKATIKTLDIEPNSGADYIADLCLNNEAGIPAESFDIIICTEVLEHTLHPFKAVDEIERMLKVGGVAIISTPCNFRIHGPLPDCWRFTEHGLKQLFRNFTNIEISSVDTMNRDLFPIQYTLIAFKK